jgi:hypothetical protein
LTEQEIKAQLMHLIGAVVNNDERASLESAVKLGGQILIDLNRIANATEALARLHGVKNG